MASLGERLVQAGLITHDDMRRALKTQEATGVRLGEVLVSIGLLSATELAYFVAKQADVPFFDLADAVPDPEMALLMPPPTGGRANYLPLFKDAEGSLVLAVTDPLSPDELQLAARGLGVKSARQVVVTVPAFDEASTRCTGTSFTTIRRQSC